MLLAIILVVFGFTMVAISCITFTSPYFVAQRSRAVITIVFGVLLMVAGALQLGIQLGPLL